MASKTFIAKGQSMALQDNHLDSSQFFQNHSFTKMSIINFEIILYDDRFVTDFSQKTAEPSPFVSTMRNFCVFSRYFICLLWGFFHHFHVQKYSISGHFQVIQQTRMKRKDSCYRCTEAFKIAHARYTCLSLILHCKQCVCWSRVC